MSKRAVHSTESKPGVKKFFSTSGPIRNTQKQSRIRRRILLHQIFVSSIYFQATFKKSFKNNHLHSRYKPETGASRTKATNNTRITEEVNTFVKIFFQTINLTKH